MPWPEAVEEPDTLNRRILAIAGQMPTGGGYRFTPAPRREGDPTNPRDPEHDGVLRDLELGGRTLARAAADGATYCCGVTLQVWLEAWRAERGADPPVDDPEALVAEWFCPTMGHPGVRRALVSRGLGRPVAPDEALPGDLVQYWRSTDLAAPSGHSAVFLGWEGGANGQRLLRYWSSQPATGGIGIHVETVGPGWTLDVVRALSGRS